MLWVKQTTHAYYGHRVKYVGNNQATDVCQLLVQIADPQLLVDPVVDVRRHRHISCDRPIGAAAAQVAGQTRVQLQFPRVQTLVVRVVRLETCDE